ncbi:MAG: PPK2 family polyphosphate:nucleotide phosphotransferase [Bacteroidia bacterium]|jgi:PPK2 family polyphosphate:nucleotide phosphotransferase
MQSYYDDNKVAVFNGSDFKLSDYKTDYTGDLKNKKAGKEKLEQNRTRLHELQRMMYANDSHSVLLVFQAMDAAGKDSTIRKVFANNFPQASRVSSFKAPTKKELDHDYLWRSAMVLPERGTFGIFNRSYYEEVLVTRVHPQYILGQRIPGVDAVSDIDETFWHKRFKAIRDHEEHLADNGTIILKFFLNVSREEQKNRFLRRIETPEKNWKFNIDDIKERGHWDEYMTAYEDAIKHTAAPHAPWFVIPADNKWFMQAAVSDVIIGALERLNLTYPTVVSKDQANLIVGRDLLAAE